MTQMQQQMGPTTERGPCVMVHSQLQSYAHGRAAAAPGLCSAIVDPQSPNRMAIVNPHLSHCTHGMGT